MELAADLIGEIKVRIACGAYESEDAVIREALEALRKKELWEAEVRVKVTAAIAESDRGESISAEEVREYFRKKAETLLQAETPA